MNTDPVCVRRTGTIEEAEVIVAWLDDQGVQATVVGRDNPGVFAFGVTDEDGVAIFVPDQSTADRAGKLLAQHDQKGGDTAGDEKLVDMACEECGESNAFSVDLRGSVQQCSSCGAYLDIPEHPL